MSRTLVRILSVWTATLAAMLTPNVVLSAADAPRNSRFLSADGIPLSDDCYLDPAVPTFFVVHGFHDSGDSLPSLQQATAIQRFLPEANVIIVDWRPPQPAHKPGQAQQASSPSVVLAIWGFYQEYLDAVASAKSIGREVAEWIRQKGILPHQTVICGHSLGAQIAAFASNECARPEMCGERLHAIIAADPAGPEFELNPPEERLDNSDAQHVIVVHTTELFGDEHLVGTADIYVEWPDEEQRNDLARHSWARDLVTQALQNNGVPTVDPAAFEPVPESPPSLLTSEILLSLPDDCNVCIATVSSGAQHEQGWGVMWQEGRTTRVRFNLDRQAGPLVGSAPGEGTARPFAGSLQMAQMLTDGRDHSDQLSVTGENQP
ncbi:MAG: alpha/beta fold hydrolase [Planctomycetaceae bacterium]|nr:MAG: alpha/beta fold hydrolase [Planctomycetaceae bacterium]